MVTITICKKNFGKKFYTKKNNAIKNSEKLFTRKILRKKNFGFNSYTKNFYAKSFYAKFPFWGHDDSLIFLCVGCTNNCEMRHSIFKTHQDHTHSWAKKFIHVPGPPLQQCICYVDTTVKCVIVFLLMLRFKVIHV